MSIRLLFRLALRSLLRNRRRSILTCSLMLVGLWSCLVLSTFARGMAARLVYSTTEAFVGHIQIHQPGYLDDPVIQYRFPESSTRSVIQKQCPACTLPVPRVKVPGVLRSERETLGVTILGIDPEAEKKSSFLRHAPLDGSYLSGPDDRGLVVGAALLERLKTDIGKRVVLTSTHATNGTVERGITIKGVFHAPLEATEERFILMGKTVAQEFLGVPGELSEIAITLEDREQAPQVVAALQALLPERSIADWKTLKPFLASIQALQSGFLFLWFSIVIGTTGLGLMNTMYMSVMERRKEFSLLGALGMNWMQIWLQVIVEACILIGVAGIGGLLAALGTYWYLSFGIDLSGFARGAARLGMETTMYPYIDSTDWVLLLCLLSGIGLIATLLPAWVASGIRPGVAIRGE